MTWRLITIPFSHYNEKARWALERFGHAYDEDCYMPVFHFAGTVPVLLPRRLGQSERAATRFSTPVLITEDRVLTDSGAIVAHAASVGDAPGSSLHWSSEAIDLDRHFSGRFGADTRRVAYFYLLPRTDLMIEMAEQTVGPAQRRAFELALPLVRKLLTRALVIEESRAMRSLADLSAEFERVSVRLADGRPFLLGDRFSAADLSFAALGSVVVGVRREDGYGAWLPGIDRLPTDYAEIVRRLRATPAGQFIVRMFAQERSR